MTQSRTSRLIQRLPSTAQDAVILNPGPSLAYLTGVHFFIFERPIVAFFTPDRPPVLVLPELEIPKAQTSLIELQLFPYQDNPATWVEAFRRAAQFLGWGHRSALKAGVEPDRLRLLEIRLLEAAIPGIRMEDARVMSDLRMHKDAEEIACMRKAIAIAEAGLTASLPLIKIGMTEKELSAEIGSQVQRAGSEGPSNPMVESGPNSANPHATVSDRKLSPGDLLVIDFGALYRGYCADITRTFAVGDVEDEFSRIVKIAGEANAAGRGIVRPGLPAGEVDRVTRAVIEQAGYGKYFTHRTGHGLGSEPHEEPYIFAENPLPLEPGMVFTVEPGIYMTGRAGARVEDDVLVTEYGAESLSTMPRELVRVGVILEEIMADLQQFEREILGQVWDSAEMWENLTYLCYTCNSRFAGTADERRAGDFIQARLKEYGLQNVAAEPFEMRGWERGECKLTLREGEREVDLPCIALPGSFGCNLDAEIIDLGKGTPADFERVGGAVVGRIVLTSSDGPGRGEKYSAALEAGAVAFIFSNAQPGLLAPTGSVGKELPAIGMAYEHAARIKHALRTGPAKAHLSMHTKVLPVTARNIVGEIPGSDPQAGWILAGGHYDGHDICQGAQDNAASTAILIEAARILSPMRAQLKAGIRFVLFSGEELGLYGSYAYAAAHAKELEPIRLVFNADVAGLAMPLVLRTQASPDLAAYFHTLPLSELDCVVNDGPGSFIMNSDHFPFNLAGIPAVWAVTSHPVPDTSWGHTAADTLDKVEPRILKQTAVAAVRVLFRMASHAENLPHEHHTSTEVQRVVAEAGFEKALRSTGRWPF